MNSPHDPYKGEHAFCGHPDTATRMGQDLRAGQTVTGLGVGGTVSGESGNGSLGLQILTDHWSVSKRPTVDGLNLEF